LQQINVRHADFYSIILRGGFSITSVVQTIRRKETSNSNKPVNSLHLTCESEASKSLIWGGKGKSRAIVWFCQ